MSANEPKISHEPKEMLANEPKIPQERNGERHDQFVAVTPPRRATLLHLLNDPNFDHDAVRKSRSVENEYRGKYAEELARLEYPLRIRRAQHTGLPAQLNSVLESDTDLDFANEQVAQKAAQQWLNESYVTPLLFGVGTQEDHERAIRYPAEVLLLPAPDGRRVNAHVAFEQKHNDLPVHGGALVVHLTEGKRTCAASNSFLPIQADAKFELSENLNHARERARELAKQALLNATLRDEPLLFGEQDFTLEVVPYQGSDTFILPFNGAYYLAMQVEYVPSPPQFPYRVFIDIQGWQVLGEPDPLFVGLTNLYNSSATAIGNASGNRMPLGSLDIETDPTRAPRQLANINDLAVALAPFATITHALDATNENEIEVVNVAFHAVRLCEYFKRLGFDATRNPSLVQLRVKEKDTHTPRELIVRTDVASSLNPKRIYFQSDDVGAGLKADGKNVFDPSLDPEVIYHELAHFLMWLVDSRPFEPQAESVPFCPAMREAYANYFARSFGARFDTSGGDERWAAAAYKQADWGLDQALAHPLVGTSWIDGQDRLLMPEMYPGFELDLNKYRVGMIWARALWDLRTLAVEAARPNGAAAIDQAVFNVDLTALNAYKHLHGWIINYEAAAEAVLLEAGRTGVGTAAIQTEMAERTIFAEIGVHSIVRTPAGEILTGSDQGVCKLNGNALTTLNARFDVISFAPITNGTDLFAASESGVWHANNATFTNWNQRATLPNDLTPLCIAHEDPFVFVGTADGIWRLDLGTNGWTHWRAAGDFADLTWNLLGSTLNVGASPVQPFRLLFAADMTQFGKVTVIRENNVDVTAAKGWKPFKATAGSALDADNAHVISLMEHAGVLYIGTITDGVYRYTARVYTPLTLALDGTITKISGVALDKRAVYCLATAMLSVTRNGVITRELHLLAGTNDGIFTMPVAGGNWTQVMETDNLMVRQILVDGAVWYAATFNHGLCVKNNASAWTKDIMPPVQV